MRFLALAMLSSLTAVSALEKDWLYVCQPSGIAMREYDDCVVFHTTSLWQWASLTFVRARLPISPPRCTSHEAVFSVSTSFSFSFFH